MSELVIGLGGNLGEREAMLASGASAIAELAGVTLVGLSRVYESDAVGPVQPRYLNAALRVASALSADALFERLLAIEVAHGRVRVERWGPRTLDLDLLWASEPVVSEQLRVPHPQLEVRSFALAPLLDVAPELASRYAAKLAQSGGAPLCIGRLVATSGGETAVAFEAAGSASRARPCSQV